MTRLLAQFAMNARFSPDVAPTAFSLLADLGLIDEVCVNRTVPFEVAVDLFRRKKKLPASAAGQLLARPWTAEQAKIFISLENRKSVLTDLVCATVLDDEGLELLLAKKDIGGMLAESVLANQPLSPSFRERFAAHGESETRIELFLETGDVESLRRELRSLDPVDGRRSAKLTDALRHAVYAHPELLDLLDEDGVLPSGVRNVFAASVHLGDVTRQRHVAGLDSDLPRDASDLWELMVLAGNPRTTKDVLTELRESLRVRPVSAHKAADLDRNIARRLDGEQYLDEGTTLAHAPADKIPWLLRRALPSSFHGGRIFELVELAANAQLDEGQAERVVSALRYRDPAVIVDAAIEGLRQRFPALAANFPVLPPAPVEEDSTPAQVRMRRRLDESTARRPVPDELRERTLGEHVDQVNFIGQWPEVLGVCASERFGADRSRWEALYVLLPEFNGTFEELLVAAQML